MRDRNHPSVILELLRSRDNWRSIAPVWLNAPGGQIERLSQYHVDFDDDERVCLDFPTSGSITSGSTLVTNLNRIRAWLSPAKWFQAHATDPPSMHLYVEPGIAYLHGTTGSPIVFIGGQTSGSFVHNSSGSPRIDILYLNGNTGALTIKAGTPGSSPVPPWPLSGSPFPIAEVYMRPCSGSIFNKCSSGSATDNYIYRDIRPFITFPGAGGGGGLGVHTHADNPEGGQLDHGVAHTDASMQDDDHRIYLKESEYTAKGDILIGTGAGTFSKQAVGNTREFLMAQGAAADGVIWHPAPYWANTVIVDPSGGEYDTVTDALNAIGDAAADNRYAILITADLGGEQVTLKSYVDLSGMGTYNSRQDDSSLVVTGAPTDVSIFNLSLARPAPTDGVDNPVYLTGGNVDFHHCRIAVVHPGIWFASTVLISGGTHKFFDCEIINDRNGYNSGGNAVAVGGGTVDLYNCILKPNGTYYSATTDFAIYGVSGTIRVEGCHLEAAVNNASARVVECDGATIYMSGSHLKKVSGNYVNITSGTVYTGGCTYEHSTVFTEDPCCRVYNSGVQSIDHNTLTALTFDSERFDTDNIHSTVANTSRLTCGTAGTYQITGNTQFDNSAAGQWRTTSILLNGATLIGGVSTHRDATSQTRMIATTLYKLAVGDYVELVMYQDTGGALNSEVVANICPEFMMVRVA